MRNILNRSTSRVDTELLCYVYYERSTSVCIIEYCSSMHNIHTLESSSRKCILAISINEYHVRSYRVAKSSN